MTWFSKIPALAYGVALALFTGALAERQHYGTTRYNDGRRSVTDGVRFDVTLLGQVRAADAAAKARTDTIIQRVTITRWKVDTLIREVPDTLTAVPEIAALITATLVLTAQVDTLTRTLDIERAVSRLRTATDSAALVTASFVITARDDAIVQLKRRPQWRTVALALGVGVVVGVMR